MHLHAVRLWIFILVLSAASLGVAALAVPLFGERLPGWQWAGRGLGLVGVGLSLSGQLGRGRHLGRVRLRSAGSPEICRSPG